MYCRSCRWLTTAAIAGLSMGATALAQPANDDCVNATVITAVPFDSGLVAAGTATNDVGVNPSCDSTANLLDARMGVWFTFTPTTSGLYQLAEAQSPDTATSVWTGGCGSLTQVHCSDPETSTVTLAAGTQYWILVSKWSSTNYAAADTIRLTVAIPGACCNAATGACVVSTTGAAGCASGSTYLGDGTICSPNPCPQPPPPANDACGSATVVSTLPFDSGVIGVSAATNDAGVNPTCDSTLNTDARMGVWFTYTPATSGPVALAELQPPDTATSVWTGGCGSLTQVSCSDPETSNVTLTGGTQYWILVSKWSSSNYAAGDSIRLTIGVLGACCNATTGVCTTTTTGASGCASGSTYLGDGTVCSPNPCPQPPPPANDLCTNAQALTVGVPVIGSNRQATGDCNEGPQTPTTAAPCVTAGTNRFVKSVWFTFTPPTTSDYLISLCGSNFDTVLGVMAGPDCNNLAFLPSGCDDDSCIGTTDIPLPGPGPGSGLASLIPSINLTAGQTVFIRVSGWAAVACAADTDTTNARSGDYGIVVQYVNPPVGVVCCRGAVCSMLGMSSCLPSGTAGATFVPTALMCNSGSNTTPCCYADYNKTGGITVQDIFDFLNDWFAGSPLADTGSDGTTAPDVQAIFDFLNAWFAGGC